ncbi:hypothetical protein ACRPK8_15550 [Exiguobacterium sp. TDN 0502]
MFSLAGLAEIGSGYLIWLLLREGRPAYFGLLGGGIFLLGVAVILFSPRN